MSVLSQINSVPAENLTLTIGQVVAIIMGGCALIAQGITYVTAGNRRRESDHRRNEDQAKTRADIHTFRNDLNSISLRLSNVENKALTDGKRSEEDHELLKKIASDLAALDKNLAVVISENKHAKERETR